MLIYLIGFMGSGKTTAGKKLAKKMAYDFIDLDSLIESETGMNISNFFEQFGEEKFRKLEQEILKKTFNYKNTVISTGGGAPCFFNNIDEINQNGISVYLKAGIPLIISRLKGGKDERPLIKEKNEEELKKYVSELLLKRETYYNRAKLVVDAKSLNIEKLKNLIQSFNN
ncbi:MAG: shikimate kinase [Bacteroidota bacterium]